MISCRKLEEKAEFIKENKKNSIKIYQFFLMALISTLSIRYLCLNSYLFTSK